MRRTPVTIALDKERRLRYDLNAMCMVEELTGESLMDLMRKPTIKNMRTVIWAGLIHEDPAITQEAVGNLIDLGELKDVIRLIHKALGLDIPAADEANPISAQPIPPVKTNGSIGHDYGASADTIVDLVSPISGG
jgi:hypothetical protein